MTLYEIFDGDTYLFTVAPSENPFKVLAQERKERRTLGLSMIAVQGGNRTVAEGPAVYEPVDDTFDFTGEDGEEMSDEA